MSYQELIACTVASLSTAWRHAMGHWLHTSHFTPSSLVLLHILLSCTALTLLLLCDNWGHFPLNYVRIWRLVHGFDFLWKLFWHPHIMPLFILQSCRYIPSSGIWFNVTFLFIALYISDADFFFLYSSACKHLHFSFILCISLCLILCSHLQNFRSSYWRSSSHVHLLASGPHFPAPSLPPPILFMRICWWGNPR